MDPEALSDWCRQWLGAVPDRTLFETGNLSAVIGLALTDGRRVVVKARRPDRRIIACVDVQRRLWEVGFPCPRPLAGPAPLADLSVTAESYLPGGRQLPPTPSLAASFGESLARLVTMAPPPSHVPPLNPPPPWLQWNHTLAGLWPRPISTQVDLNALSGPHWLDEIAHRVQNRLARFDAPAVIGHSDFESQNLRWRAGRLYAVHDWDSVVALPEAVIAGAAAAAHPAIDSAAAAASIAQNKSFLHAYAGRRRKPWTANEREVCWAAGLWVLAYNAKVEIAESGNALAERVRRDADRRLTLADA